MGLTPALFTSAKPDGADPTKLQPSYWNRLVALINSLFDGADAHGSLLYRNTADTTDGASYLPDVAVGSVLASGGVGAAPTWSASPTVTNVLLGNGTAGAPSIAFSSQSDLGFYRFSSTSIGFTSAGSAIGFMNSGGIAFTSTGAGLYLGPGQDTILQRGGAAGKVTLVGTTPTLQMGGTTSTFPAIKRDTVFLQLRLADDSAVSGAATASLPAAAAARDGIICFDTTLNALVYYVGGARFKLVGTAF